MEDSLGNRMKDYEACFDYRLPQRCPMILRVDGKTFHTMTKKWECEKPFDSNLYMAMRATMFSLCEFISGATMGYMQSDEISIVVRDDTTVNTQPFLDKRIQKLCSVIASKASVSFNDAMRYSPKFDGEQYDSALFDCRVFIVPEYEIQNYMVWRQQDATRNSVQMLAQSLYSHKELQGKKNAELQEMCFKKGKNWNDCETWQKRGVCAVKHAVEKEHDGNKFIRNVWAVDDNIPVFTQDKEYVYKYTKRVEQ